jgi:cytochrome P450
LAGSEVFALMERVRREGPVLRTRPGFLGIFDPVLALDADIANASDLKVPRAFWESLLPGRDRREVSWREVRALIIDRSRRLNRPEHLAALRERMRASLAGHADLTGDLTRIVAKAMSDSLVPMIIDGLGERGLRAVAADLDGKLDRLLAAPGGQRTLGYRAAVAMGELAAGRAVARQLRRRLRGTAPARDDFADELLGLAPDIGLGRVTYLTTTLLTAISSAPGLAAACLLFELVRRPEWKQRISAEMAALPIEARHVAPSGEPSLTARFIRETLRFWAFPLVTRRIAYRDIEVGGERVGKGEVYELSSYIMHHSETHWDDPERFDPDRWLPGRTQPQSGTYAPFGFGPRTCIGAAVGFSQLMLFCELATLDFAFDLAPGPDPSIRLDGVAVPIDLVGCVRPTA